MKTEAELRREIEQIHFENDRDIKLWQQYECECHQPDGARVALAIIIFVVLFVALLASTGCTHNEARRKTVMVKEQERTRELVQGASLANQVGRERLLTIASNSEALVAYDLSGKFLGRAQSIVGLPVIDQSEVVAALLSTNRALRAEAEAAEKNRRTQEQVWAAQRAKLEGDLIEMGTKYEEEHNRSIVRRVWTWAISTLGIGGIVALCVFCPAVIPIFGRLLGSVVAKIPSLAGALGVVSTKAYDAMVRGIENAKSELHQSGAETVLHDNLSKEMDEAHKKLVLVRKAAIAA